jgi:hypothetical protein
MARNSWQVTSVVLAAGLAFTQSIAQATDPDPVIAIRVDDPNGSVTASLPRAQAIATDIYRQAGVTLQWAVDESTSANRTLMVIMTTSAMAPAGITRDATGVAPTPGDGSRGTTAFVFSDRVAAFAKAYRLAESDVLASALAHEIGHLLLPPNAHAANGIMRASWRPAFFPPKAPGVPGFPPEQARLLRIRVLSR